MAGGRGRIRPSKRGRPPRRRRVAGADGASQGGPILLYDGDCAFCTACARFVERNIAVRARLRPFQSADLDVLGVTAERASREVVWVRPDGRAYGGAHAVALLLISAGGVWWPVGALLRVPPVSWLAGGAYRLIARNRHRLPGATAACEVPRGGPARGDAARRP